MFSATNTSGRVVLVVAIEPWLFDALAAFGTDLKDREPELDEQDEI